MTNTQHALLLLLSDVERNYQTKATVFADMGVLRVDLKIDSGYNAAGSYRFIHSDETALKQEINIFTNLLGLSEGVKPSNNDLTNE